MALSSLLSVSPTTLLLLLLPISLVAFTIHRLYLCATAHIPGPLLARLSPLPFWLAVYQGREATWLAELHAQYGSIVLIAPDEVSISAASAVQPIYVSRGGFPKAAYYRNFDVDGHATIFSETDPVARGRRAKAVMPLFSTASIAANLGSLQECVESFVQRLRSEAERSKKRRVGAAGGDDDDDDEGLDSRRVDVLNLTRSLAIDVVTTHLFDANYAGTTEKTQRLSVSSFVDSYVAVGRYFNLPPWLFALLESSSSPLSTLISSIGPKLGLNHVAEDDEETAQSFALVDQWVNQVVNATPATALNYPGRLKAAGISDDEVKSQCKDLMFAGTDSSGMNLATIIRELARQPEIYHTLKEELASNPSCTGTELSSLPYLSAVIREGLRTSMANPTRFPHVIPSSSQAGWTCEGITIPPGVKVGVSPHQLHFNETIFPSPKRFWPERWLSRASSGAEVGSLGPEVTSEKMSEKKDGGDAESKDRAREEMSKHHIPFGAGSRACIARNLATTELFLAVAGVVRSGVLDGAKAVDEDKEVQIVEWFNSRVVGEKIEIFWE